MSSVKKIGWNLTVKNIVIHQLLKDARTTNVNPRAARGVLTIGDKERLFLGKLDKSYHKKSSPVYGIFANENTTFKDSLMDYINENQSFYDFSIRVMNHYKGVLELTTSATGGYMILCEYTNDSTNNDLFLVLMINNKEGFMVNENLTLNDIKNLDLNKVDVACLINLTEWKRIELEEDTERKTYLSFVKGLKQVSNYFMRFLDVDNKTTSTESTNRLITAIEDFAKSKKWNRSITMGKKNKVFEYCHKCMDNRQEILIESIANILDPESPEIFLDLATDDTHKVSAIISGDKQRMRLLKTITYNSDELKLEFDMNLLVDKKIILENNDKNLVIKDISDELIKKIKKLSNNAE